MLYFGPLTEPCPTFINILSTARPESSNPSRPAVSSRDDCGQDPRTSTVQGEGLDELRTLPRERRTTCWG
jgi:hypothetical protein